MDEEKIPAGEAQTAQVPSADPVGPPSAPAAGGETPAEPDGGAGSPESEPAGGAAEEEENGGSNDGVRELVMRRIGDDVLEISRFDGAVNTLGDVLKSEKYPEMLSLVKLGLSIPQAYKVANFDRLIKEAERRGTLSARTSRASKEHLKRTEMRGFGAEVPEEIMNEYRAFCPELSDAEIRKHYGRYAARRAQADEP